MSEYKDIVGIVKFQDGTYDCYPDSAGIPPSVDYIKLDIADQLAAVLSRVSSYLRDEGIRQNESYYDGKLRKQAEIGYTALEAYRKAKGE